MIQLNLYSAVQQQKAVLALAQEQMQIIELERRLVQAEAEKGSSFLTRSHEQPDLLVMRDHRISLFKAREADLLAEMEEKDSRLEELEVSHRENLYTLALTKQEQLAQASTSAGHQRASDSNSRVALESKVEKLEAKIAIMSSTEQELRQELESLLSSEKTNENSVRPSLSLRLSNMLMIRWTRRSVNYRQCSRPLKPT